MSAYDTDVSIYMGDIDHALGCTSSQHYVRPFSNEIADNWFVTKRDYRRVSQKLGLSEYQKVVCFRSCLRGAARCMFDNVYASQRTLGEIFSALDEHFNIYRPLKIAHLLSMKQGDAERVGDFFLRVYDEAENLFFLSESAKEPLIIDAILGGVSPEVRYFVLCNIDSSEYTLTVLYEELKLYERSLHIMDVGDDDRYQQLQQEQNGCESCEKAAWFALQVEDREEVTCSSFIGDNSVNVPEIGKAGLTNQGAVVDWSQETSEAWLKNPCAGVDKSQLEVCCDPTNIQTISNGGGIGDRCEPGSLIKVQGVAAEIHDQTHHDRSNRSFALGWCADTTSKDDRDWDAESGYESCEEGGL